MIVTGHIAISRSYTSLYVHVHPYTSMYVLNIKNVPICPCTSLYVPLYPCTPLNVPVHPYTSLYTTLPQCSDIPLSLYPNYQYPQAIIKPSTAMITAIDVQCNIYCQPYTLLPPSPTVTYVSPILVIHHQVPDR